MTGAESMKVETGAGITARRAAFAALIGGVVLAGAGAPAKAATSSSVDTAQLQFALNLQYLTTNYLQVVTYGFDSKPRQLPAELIRGGELTDKPGVSATTVKPITFSRETRGVQARIREMADEHWDRTKMLRAVLRADTPAQTLIDYRAETFTTMFRLAGAIANDATFDPYSSPANCLLGAETLLSVQASVYSAILPAMTDEVAMAMMGSMGASAASNATSIRTMLAALAQADPGIWTIVDRLAAWRDQVDGSAVTDRGLSPGMSDGQTTTRMAVTNADGGWIGRTPQQALNVLFMTANAVTQGGFFPNGINGTIVSSGQAG